MQLNNYVQNKFSIYLTGFWKNHDTKTALIKMIVNCKAKLNNDHQVGVIYIDLSKGLDSLNHEFLVAKL